MELNRITWLGESIDDVELLPEVPANLARLLSERNGFIVDEGALHMRGACLAPEWHSLRAAWRGPGAFHFLYSTVKPSDIPFAQDQFGDQFLIRDDAIVRLSGETGEVSHQANSLEEFLGKTNKGIEEFLNVGLQHKMKPGELLHVFPPFVFKDSGTGVSIKAISATEVILFHADLARQIRDLPDGSSVEFKLSD